MPHADKLRSWVAGRLAMLFGNMTGAELRDLLLPVSQSPLVQRRRAALIISRVRMVAATFALLTPLWIPVDLILFDSALGVWLAGLRVAATVAFGVLAVSFRQSDDIHQARASLFLMLSIPMVFFVFTLPLLGVYPVEGEPARFVATGYAFLPFVMVAGLSVFPITAIEGVVLSVPLWVVAAVEPFFGFAVLPFANHLGALWLLALLAVVATLAGMSQLHFMMQLVRQASHDGLTRAYTRRVGEEMLDLQFSQAQRGSLPLAVVFVDLDDFKKINDRYGHEEGDSTLRAAAAAMRRVLRRADILVRWGGEEFLVVMPNTGMDGARIAIERLCDGGLGKRPDGTPQTASIGIAERDRDGAESWAELVEKADQRMYAAKQSGKARVVCDSGTPAPAAAPA